MGPHRSFSSVLARACLCVLVPLLLLVSCTGRPPEYTVSPEPVTIVTSGTLLTSPASNRTDVPDLSSEADSTAETPGDVTVEVPPAHGNVLTVTAVSDATYYERGRERLDARDFDDAIAELTRAIELRPDWAAPRYLRGWAHYEAGRMDAAIADYDRAIELLPTWAAPLLGRSLVCHGKDEHDAALADATRAVEIDPCSYAHYTRGTIQWVVGHDKEALSDFDEAIRLSPRDRWPRFWRGMLYLVAGDPEVAEADMRESLAVSPADKPYLALHGLCVVLLHRGRDKDMIGLLTEHLSHECDDLTSWKRASLQYLVGTLSEKELYALAERQDRAETRMTVAEKTLSAHFFVAMKASAAGDALRAAERFRKCIRTGVVHFTGYTIAEAWLLRHSR